MTFQVKVVIRFDDLDNPLKIKNHLIMAKDWLEQTNIRRHVIGEWHSGPIYQLTYHFDNMDQALLFKLACGGQ